GEIVLSAQVIDAIEILRVRQGLYLRGDWQALAAREVKKRGYRIGVKDGANWKPCLPQRGQRAAAYARSEEARARWTIAAMADVLAELQKNEAAITKLRAAHGRITPFEVFSGLATQVKAEETDAGAPHKGRPPIGDTAMSNAERQKRWYDQQKGNKEGNPPRKET